MPIGKARIRGGVAWRKKVRLKRGDREYIASTIRENREDSAPGWSQEIEETLIADVKHAIGFAASVDKTQTPTATEQRKKLKRIQKLALDLIVEILGGQKSRGKSAVRVKGLDIHTIDALHRAIRRHGGSGFVGLDRREFINLLDDIARADILSQTHPSSHPHPYRQYLLDELASIWVRHTGRLPHHVTIDPETGMEKGAFYFWAERAFKLAFGDRPPRERVDEAVSKLKK